MKIFNYQFSIINLISYLCTLKAACEEVHKRYANAKSIYLKYDLYRITASAEPGIHQSSAGASFTHESVFDARLRSDLGQLAEDVPAYDNYLATICDSIANAHAADTLTVEAKVQLFKHQFLKEGQMEIWNHTFLPTVQ